MKILEQLLNQIEFELNESGRFPGMKSELSGYQMDQMPQVHKIMAGQGHKKPIKDIDHIVARFGGKPEHWQKISSPSMRDENNKPFSIHAYRNSETGEVVNHKTKLNELPVNRNTNEIAKQFSVRFHDYKNKLK